MTPDEALAVADQMQAASDQHGIIPVSAVLAAEVRRLRALVEWQPIETAPKDGTRIDLRVALYNGGPYCVSDMWYVKALGDKPAIWRNANNSIVFEADVIRDPKTRTSITHWRPIGPGPGDAP